MKNDKKTQIDENIHRALLMMKYDMKKTLNENEISVNILSEQEQVNNAETDAIEINREFNKFNTDEQKVVDIIKKYDSPSKIKSLLDAYKNKYKRSLGLDMGGIISKGSDKKELDDLKNHLNQYGITLEYKLYNLKGGGNKSGYEFKFGSETQVITTTTTQRPTTPCPVGDTDAVKKFHNWLNDNVPNWHDKYGDLKDKNVNKGYGVCGPRTRKLWLIHKDDFNKPITPATQKTTPELKTTASKTSDSDKIITNKNNTDLGIENINSTDTNF